MKETSPWSDPEFVRAFRIGPVYRIHLSLERLERIRLLAEAKQEHARAHGEDRKISDEPGIDLEIRGLKGQVAAPDLLRLPPYDFDDAHRRLGVDGGWDVAGHHLLWEIKTVKRPWYSFRLSRSESAKPIVWDMGLLFQEEREGARALRFTTRARFLAHCKLNKYGCLEMDQALMSPIEDLGAFLVAEIPKALKGRSR